MPDYQTNNSQNDFGFGPFVIRTGTGELERSGSPVPLRQQPADLLLLLLENAGELVTREQIIERLWGDRIVEYDLGIKSCIHQLRVALDDDAADPTWIETVPRRGFRFIGRVKELNEAASKKRRLIAAFAIPAVAVAAALAMIGGSEPPDGLLQLAFSTSSFSQDDFTDEWNLLSMTTPLPRLSDRGQRRLTVEPRGEQLLGILQDDGKMDSLLVEAETGVSAARVLARSTAAAYLRTRGLDTSQLPERARGSYEQARHLMLRNTRPSMELATAILDSIGEFAPDHPMLIAAKSSTRLHTGYIGDARALASEALQLDEESAEARNTLGVIALMIDWEWETARTELTQAIQSAPGWAEPHVWLSFLLSALGRHQEAISHGELAAALDAVSPVLYGDLGLIYMMAGRYDLAAHRCLRTLTLDSESFAGHLCIFDASLLAGDSATAAVYARRLLVLLDERIDPETVRRPIRDLHERLTQISDHSYLAAVAHTGLGNRERAIETIRRAVEVHRSVVQQLDDGMRQESGTLMLMVAAADPRLDPLRDDPAFIAAASEIGPNTTAMTR